MAKSIPHTEPSIFLSYGRDDQATVERYYDDLKAAGLSPWMDSRDLRAGERWELRVIEQLEKADFIILFLSRNSVSRRGFVQKEIRDAIRQSENMLDHDIFVIPVRIDDCHVPSLLARFQWIDLFQPNAFDHLVRAIWDGVFRRIDRVRQPSLSGADVEQIAQRAVRFWHAEAMKKGLRVEIDNLLPPQVALTYDVGALEDLLLNVIGNAIKYSLRDRKVTVVLKGSDLKGNVNLEITSEGVPIQQMAEENIFRFSSREKWDDEEAQGSGLGLYIARSTIHRCSGDLRVQSTKGDDANRNVFTIRLPFAKEDQGPSGSGLNGASPG